MGSAYVLFRFIETTAGILRFHTQSGLLSVKQEGDLLWMDFPSRPAVPAVRYMSIEKAIGMDNIDVYRSADLLVVLENEEAVRQVRPDFETLKRVKYEAEMPDDNFGVIVTAPGSDCDFVSRFFAPNVGINEDPVTGRAHCVLIPYWSKQTGKVSMTARQLSKRGGTIWCEYAGERVKIGGKAVLYMAGEIVV